MRVLGRKVFLLCGRVHFLHCIHVWLYFSHLGISGDKQKKFSHRGKSNIGRPVFISKSRVKAQEGWLVVLGLTAL